MTRPEDGATARMDFIIAVTVCGERRNFLTTVFFVATNEDVTNTELQRRALALPEVERRALGEVLIHSTFPRLTAGEQAELERAWEAYQANPEDVHSAEEVHELMARLGK